MAYKEIYYLLDLSQQSGVEWYINRYIVPTKDGHALYKLVLERADTSGCERQEQVFANDWDMKISQLVPSPLEMENFGTALYSNWLEIEGSVPAASKVV